MRLRSTKAALSKGISVSLFFFLMGFLFFLLPCGLMGATPPVESSASAQLIAADELAESGSLDKAVEAYTAIVKNSPFSKEAPLAQFKLAQLLQQKHDLERAFKAYTYLLQKYPQTSHFEQAVAEEVNIANAFLQGARVKVFGIPTVPSMEKAEEMYTSILKVSPYSKYAALTQFNLGLAMERQGKGKEAIANYQKLIDKYPNSDVCDDALYQVGYVYMRMGMTGKSQDLSALKEAHNNFEDFLIQYPNSEKTLQARDNMKLMLSRQGDDNLRIARFYDFTKDYKSAAIYYNEVIRRFPQTEDAKAAKTRLEDLRAEVGDDALRAGQQRPESGDKLALRRRLQAQVETTALSNYDGPPKKAIMPEELPAPRPEMRTNLKDAQPLPALEGPVPAATPQQMPSSQ